MSHRTQITLTDEQYSLLRGLSEISGQSLAELVRRAVIECYGPASAEDLASAIEASFASWIGREIDGASYVEHLRRGMERRLADDR